MKYARFLGSKDIVQIRMENLGDRLIKISPTFPKIELTTGFELLTKAKNGNVYGDYTKYTTVYRELEDGSVILSDDGRVYVPPEPPKYTIRFVLSNGKIIGEDTQELRNFEELTVPEVEMDKNYEFSGWNMEIPTEGTIDRNYTFYAIIRYIPTLEEVKAQKKAEISAACENTIHAGINVKIGENWEHFSLETNDQINLFGKQYQLANGATSVEYHQDGFPCKYYSAEDMMEIITAAMEWVSYHTTYCNALNMWIAGATSKDEVNGIYYGADIPEEYQSEVLKDYLTMIAAEAEEVLNEGEAVS